MLMSHKSSDNVNNVLNILGNETRRRILYLLSAEPRYFIQLSRDLGVSQQAILKHLELLEKNGIIDSYREKSELAAPARKYYHLNKSLYLSIGITNDNVKMEIREIDSNKTESKNTLKDLMLDNELTDSLDNDKDLDTLLSSSNILLKKIDSKISDIEQEKVSLLRLRQIIMKKIHDAIRLDVDNVLERTILYSLISSDFSIDVESLSEQFDVREKEIDVCISALKQRLNLLFE